MGQNLQHELKELGIPYVGGSRSTGVDARDRESVISWIIKNGIAKLVNLAADCGGIGKNLDIPAQLWQSTTAISCSVLEAVRLTGVEKYVYLGTVCSYPKNCPVPFKEEYLLHYNPPEETNLGYGLAKLNGIQGCIAYKKQYGLDITCLLPANMYGPYDNFDLRTSHVIPAIIRKCIDAVTEGSYTLQCWGTGTATREFLHARDCSKAIIKALDHHEIGPYNIGVGKDICIADLVKMICKRTGFDGNIDWNGELDGQPKRLLDISRAAHHLGYAPSIALGDGLQETIDWYINRLT